MESERKIELEIETNIIITHTKKHIFKKLCVWERCEKENSIVSEESKLIR